MLEQQYGCTEFFTEGKYAAGHPEIDQPMQEIVLAFCRDRVMIFNSLSPSNLVRTGEILYSDITSISVDDAYTLERKITARGLHPVSGFAFASVTKTKENIFYTTIILNNAGSENEIFIEFEGDESLSNAENLKGLLVKYVTKSAQTAVL